MAGTAAASAPSSPTSGPRNSSPRPPSTMPVDDRPPDGERRDVLDLAGLRRVVLGGAEQPRHQRAAPDAEHAADRHHQAEQRGAERDRSEQGGVVLRADEPRVDDVVQGTDDHRGGHRHAQVHEGAEDRGGGEVPAVLLRCGGGCGGRWSSWLVPFRAARIARRRDAGTAWRTARRQGRHGITGSASAVPSRGQARARQTRASGGRPGGAGAVTGWVPAARRSP